ncbi:hypothetical protein FFWV33_07370 [Flavobacterium faecale]|uniref:Uncharacterized protein n=1 Tax=Flavobacterium faecale TaxID=1355330 RepID=A0A2S1LCC6_9FLAO|nr:hypothetical protein FFWV33_07370 [Flavobacterium faecale]
MEILVAVAIKPPQDWNGKPDPPLDSTEFGGAHPYCFIKKSHYQKIFSDNEKVVFESRRLFFVSIK